MAAFLLGFIPVYLKLFSFYIDRCTTVPSNTFITQIGFRSREHN